jgi:DNA-binding NtrC family response regulator
MPEHVQWDIKAHERRQVTVQLAGRHGSEPVLISASPAMQELRTAAIRVAAGTAKVLITGESGVGKDLLARFIHAKSPRASRAFVAVNCGAVSDSLLESELFGHVRGSFTGAIRDKVGKLELAHHGTVFLDEVADMSLRMQVMLLRFLENGEIQRVGSDAIANRVDVRVIAATNQDLPALVVTSRFREDLLYRLKVAHLHVPPLRERREEIRTLIAHTVAASGLDVKFSEDALAALDAYRWPGNVRELQNVVESLIWTSGSDAIGLEQLPAPVRAPDTTRVQQVRERRRQLADELYFNLVSGSFSFWEHVHTLFMNRDITRHDIRELVRRGLAATSGNYRALLKLFGMDETEYKRFLNFLATHDCSVDYRVFRRGLTADTPIDSAVTTARPRGRASSARTSAGT